VLGAKGEFAMNMVPEFFQDESEEALRAQVKWQHEHPGLGDSFFAGDIYRRAVTVVHGLFQHQQPLQLSAQAAWFSREACARRFDTPKHFWELSSIDRIYGNRRHPRS
jgi:hypothetical protein